MWTHEPVVFSFCTLPVGARPDPPAFDRARWRPSHSGEVEFETIAPRRSSRKRFGTKPVSRGREPGTFT